MLGKSNKEREVIEDGLEAQINLAADLARRNPWMKDLDKKYPNRFYDLNPDNDPYYAEFDKRFAEIYGEVFPTFFSPTLLLEDVQKRPSEITLRIDLNYTKEEIMHRIERIVHWGIKNYQKSRSKKYERKVPRKWRDYLEVWDLKAGENPWIKDSEGVPFAPRMPRGKKHPWTYEEIARHKYPNEQNPEDLKRAINRVKKQYRAACELIYGAKYDPAKVKQDKERISSETKGQITCDKCPDKLQCKDLCPSMVEELKKLEVDQQHFIPRDIKSSDIEDYKKGWVRYPKADKQF
jgi:hypothetical protein